MRLGSKRNHENTKSTNGCRAGSMRSCLFVFFVVQKAWSPLSPGRGLRSPPAAFIRASNSSSLTALRAMTRVQSMKSLM